MTDIKQGTRVTMPKLGESVTEGTLGSWLKQIGERVEKYEPVVEVVTDKVTAEIPAPVSGTLVEILGEEGATIPVGTPICVIDTGESAAPADDVLEQVAEMAVEAADEVQEVRPSSTSGTAGTPVTSDIEAARQSRDEQAMLRIRSSPLVRRLASEHGIDLSSIDGSGIGGRVTKSDIESAIAAEAESPAATPQPEETAPVPMPAEAQAAPRFAPPVVQLMPGDEVIQASQMRRQIADNMVRSVQTAPHVTAWMEADMSNVVAARAKNRQRFREAEGFELSFMPFILQVLVQALREQPELNAAWDDGRIIRRKAINVGIAVSVDDGLIVPVIHNADEKSLVGLARSVHDLATRARANKLSPDDVTGGTFTLNNPGTFGTLFSTPIIVQPQAAILSIEAITKRAVVVNDAIAIRPMMNLSLSIDHRILDGLHAARFLGRIKQGLENFPADIKV